MKHDRFVKSVIHHIGNSSGLNGGAMNSLYQKHKPELLGALNLLINRGSHPGTGAGFVTGGKMDGCGGNLHTGGSLYTGGKMHDPFGLTGHKDMYHHVLSLSPAHWELYREKAAQVLGAKPSPMWNHLPQHGNLAFESSPENYQHIMRMPNTHAAARMVEGEASSRGAGFLKALKHVHNQVRPFYPSLANSRLPNLNPKVEIERLKSFLHPLSKSVSSLAKGLHPEQSFHNVKNAFHGAVRQHLPSLQHVAADMLGLPKMGHSKPLSSPASENPSLEPQPMATPQHVQDNASISNSMDPGGSMYTGGTVYSGRQYKNTAL